MSAIFDKRANAHKHTVVQGDTLTALAAHYRTQGADYATDLSAEQIAVFNWLSNDAREIKRALFEQLGSATLAALGDGSAFADLVLDPAFGPAGTKEVLIPKLWKPASLAVGQTHTVKLKKRKAAVALGIVSLDKWFIPDLETCDLKYRTEGNASEADQVEFEVHASNYCSMAAWNEGLPTFTALADVPVFKSPLAGGLSAPRAEHTLGTWRGLTNCTQGILAPGPDGAPRHLNAALSPYTAALRYRKAAGGDATDKAARIDLAPFWLEFDAGTNLATADSSKVRWTVKGTGRLTQGLLVIVDKDNTAVFAKGLEAALLAQDTAQEFAWNAQHADGTAASAARAPYRVRIEGHTGIDVDEGLALAAMHTEVRLFVHQNTHLPTLNPYVTATDEASLQFSIADHWHKTVDPVEGDGSLWTKWEMARAGFHPGPVRDASLTPEFQSALREFQRSVIKWPQLVSNPGARLTLTAGADNDETKAALKHLAKGSRRPAFGRPADRGSYVDTFDASGKVTAEARDDAGFRTTLNDRAQRLVVWVDDRNWYSHENLSSPARTADLTTHPSALGDQRGQLGERDSRVAMDANDIARPWIPLQVDLCFLGKAQSLTDVVALPGEQTTAARWRRLVGPLRVDWTFDEIETTAPVNTTSTGAATNVDLPVLDPEIETTLAGLYHRERTRTRVALRWALDNLKRSHPRLDVQRTADYYNCPEANGGIRPTALGTYYTKAIAHEAQSLLPWKAKADAAREAIATVVHDNLGQPEADLFAKRRGRAGVYFNPSRIAGDGYRVRAQVVFDTFADWQFPNAAVLAKRYPKRPQAHTASFRLWRKTSLRSYVSWSPINSWTAPAPTRPNFPANGPRGFRSYFTAGHLHIENEGGASDAELADNATALLNAAAYKALVMSILPPGDERRANPDWITLSDRMWPWAGHAQFGVPQPAAANLPLANSFYDLNTRFIDTIQNDYHVLVCALLARAVEARRGRMRGHVLVEFQSTPTVNVEKYTCKRCNGLFTFIERDDHGLVDRKCPTAGCGDKWFFAGKLRTTPRWRGHYECAGTVSGVHRFTVFETTAAGGGTTGTPCPNCALPLAPSQINLRRYRCGECSFESAYPEPGVVPGNSHLNDPCPCTPCTGTMSPRSGAVVVGPEIDVLNASPAHQMLFPYAGNQVVGLPISSMGNPQGVAMNFMGDTQLWAHELAHTRYHLHAGSAPGGDVNEHDTTNNSTVTWNALVPPEANAAHQRWDRACLMTYALKMPTFDPNKDMVCLCHKCLLRSRGWRLAGVPSPNADVLDP